MVSGLVPPALKIISEAVSRALVLFKNTGHLQRLRTVMMALDFSWDRSAAEYIDLYKSLNPTI